MGIYDRDYQRDSYDQPGPAGFQLSGPLTLTTKLVLVIFAVYVVQLLTKPAAPAFLTDQGWFTNLFRLHGDVLLRPWLLFELVTYGFLHDPEDLLHILLNMLGLWMFGRSVEQRFGRREFLIFFLAAVAFAGLVWVLAELIANGRFVGTGLIGASGGVAAVLILFAMNFPHQTVYIWGLLPIKAWIFALIFVAMDLFNAMNRGDSQVAYTAHLGGALFAAIYFKGRFRLENWLPGDDWLRRLRPRPKLRVHFPEVDGPDETTDNQVDEILQKIQEHGQDSLTRRERKILEEASRQYQKRRR